MTFAGPIIVVIDKLVPGGLALARDDDGVLFVRGALPGEVVRVEIESERKGTRYARLLEVMTRSPDRVTPDCGLHPRCGGCDLLDLHPRKQAAVKREIVIDALTRVGKLAREDAERLVRATVAHDGAGAGQRRRARMRVNRDGALTFSERESHERVAVEACPALHPALNGALARVRGLALAPGSDVRLALDDAGHVGIAIETGADVGPPFEERGDGELFGEVAPGVAGGPYVSDAATFTQATRFGGRAILEHVLEAVGTGETREGGPLAGLRVLELFAGAGHLTLALVAAGARVEAVEGDARAVEFLEKNLAQARRSGAIGAADARAQYVDGALPFRPHDVLIADPPRTGIPGVAAILARSQAKTLALVSCDPATGARDLRAAVDAGFALQWVQPIDAFPRTSHVETVARLVRGD